MAEQSIAAERLNASLRSWYGVFSDLGRQFGMHVGMHHSDASALIQITDAEQRGLPLTQAELARRIGLTNPATSALVNRLERGGRVERRRDRPDGRVVTLRSTTAVHDQIRAFFREVGADLDDVARRYPDAVLATTAEMIERMTEVMERHLDRMLQRDAPSGSSST